MRIVVAKEDHQRRERGTQRGTADRDHPVQQAGRRIGAQRDGRGDGAGADGEREAHGIEAARLDFVVGQVLVIGLGDLGGDGAVLAVVVEQLPAGDRHQQAAADAHDGQRDAEEGQHVRADEDRRHQHEPAIDGDLARDALFGAAADVAQQVGEDRRDAQGIEDGQERDRDQDDRLEEKDEHGAIRNKRH